MVVTHPMAHDTSVTDMVCHSSFSSPSSSPARSEAAGYPLPAGWTECFKPPAETDLQLADTRATVPHFFNPLWPSVLVTGEALVGPLAIGAEISRFKTQFVLGIFQKLSPFT